MFSIIMTCVCGGEVTARFKGKLYSLWGDYQRNYSFEVH